MSDTVKKLLFVVLAIGLAALGIFVGYRHFNDQAKAAASQRRQAETTLEQLRALDANRQQYIDGAEQYKTDFEAKLAEFPSHWNQEYQIEFLEAIKKNENIEYDPVAQGYVKPSLYYTLGSSNAEGEIADTTTEDVAADSTEATDATATEETATSNSEQYQCYLTPVNMDYEGDYNGVKDFVKHVMNYGYRMTIDKVSIAEDTQRAGVLVGSMTMNQYYITGNGREEQDDIDLSEVAVGVNDLFAGGDGAAAASSKWSEDNGSGIVNDYDLYVAVNATSSDASGKQVAIKGGASLTSDANSSETVTVELTNDGDTYTAIIGIGDEKKTEEFTPGEDLTMLIQSSAVKDTDDKNGVTMKITNNTDKTLYVKVADDNDRRVKLSGSEGKVVVFK